MLRIRQVMQYQLFCAVICATVGNQSTVTVQHMNIGITAKDPTELARVTLKNDVEISDCFDARVRSRRPERWQSRRLDHRASRDKKSGVPISANGLKWRSDVAGYWSTLHIVNPAQVATSRDGDGYEYHYVVPAAICRSFESPPPLVLRKASSRPVFPLLLLK